MSVKIARMTHHLQLVVRPEIIQPSPPRDYQMDLNPSPKVCFIYSVQIYSNLLKCSPDAAGFVIDLPAIHVPEEPPPLTARRDRAVEGEVMWWVNGNKLVRGWDHNDGIPTCKITEIKISYYWGEPERAPHYHVYGEKRPVVDGRPTTTTSQARVITSTRTSSMAGLHLC